MIINMTGGGSGQSLLISDTTDANGGIIRTITGKVVKLQTKTITPTSSIQTVNPDTGYDGFSQVTVEAGGDGDEFVILFSYDDLNERWVPDKAYIEIRDAFWDGKNIVCGFSDPFNAQYFSVEGYYMGMEEQFAYKVYDKNISTDFVIEYIYVMTDVGIMDISDRQYDLINLQNKTVTPTTSQQSITSDYGYTGLGTVTVNAMPTLTLPTSASSSATTGYTNKATISRSTSNQYINIGTGYNSAGGYYTISATPNGSVTAPSSISGTTATVSTGTNTLTLTKSVSVTPNVTTAGYISSGTAGNSSVSLTASVTTKAAATITPTTTNQTIAAGTYLTGTQTIAGDADLVGSNIISTANIFGVQGTVVLQTVYTGSSAPSSSTGANGDIYIQS